MAVFRVLLIVQAVALLGFTVWAGWSAWRRRSSAHAALTMFFAAALVTSVWFMFFLFVDRASTFVGTMGFLAMRMLLQAAGTVGLVGAAWMLASPQRLSLTRRGVALTAAAWLVLGTIYMLVLPSPFPRVLNHVNAVDSPLAALIVLVALSSARDDRRAWGLAVVALGFLFLRMYGAILGYFWSIISPTIGSPDAVVLLVTHGAVLVAAVILMAVAPTGRRAPYGMFLGAAGILVLVSGGVGSTIRSTGVPLDLVNIVHTGSILLAYCLLAWGTHSAVLHGSVQHRPLEDDDEPSEPAAPPRDTPRPGGSGRSTARPAPPSRTSPDPNR